MFDFYLKIYRSGLITFCGVDVKVNFDVNGSDGKFGFREYDNGRFKNMIPISKHSNILRGVIFGKKGWGLLVKNWSEGIGSGLFTKFEFFEMLNEYGIGLPDSIVSETNFLLDMSEGYEVKLPESLYIEFNNAVWKERDKNEEDCKGFEQVIVKNYKEKLVR